MPDSKVEVKACPEKMRSTLETIKDILQKSGMPDKDYLIVKDLIDIALRSRSPIANNGVSLDYIKKVVDDSTSNILDDCCLDKISSAIHAKLQPTAINNGVSLHEITELVSALEDMINYYKPHNWVSTETGYEVLNKAQKVLSKLQTTAPRGGNMIDVVKKAVESGAVRIKLCDCLEYRMLTGKHYGNPKCPDCSGNGFTITEGEVSGG